MEDQRPRIETYIGILGRFGSDRGTWMYQIRKKRGARRRVRSVERNMDGEAML
jgi:hypothetical protein